MKKDKIVKLGIVGGLLAIGCISIIGTNIYTNYQHKKELAQQELKAQEKAKLEKEQNDIEDAKKDLEEKKQQKEKEDLAAKNAKLRAEVKNASNGARTYSGEKRADIVDVDTIAKTEISKKETEGSGKYNFKVVPATKESMIKFFHVVSWTNDYVKGVNMDLCRYEDGDASLKNAKESIAICLPELRKFKDELLNGELPVPQGQERVAKRCCDSFIDILDVLENSKNSVPSSTIIRGLQSAVLDIKSEIRRDALNIGVADIKLGQ